VVRGLYRPSLDTGRANPAMNISVRILLITAINNYCLESNNQVVSAKIIS